MLRSNLCTTYHISSIYFFHQIFVSSEIQRHFYIHTPNLVWRENPEHPWHCVKHFCKHRAFFSVHIANCLWKCMQWKIVAYFLDAPDAKRHTCYLRCCSSVPWEHLCHDTVDIVTKATRVILRQLLVVWIKETWAPLCQPKGNQLSKQSPRKETRYGDQESLWQESLLWKQSHTCWKQTRRNISAGFALPFVYTSQSSNFCKDSNLTWSRSQKHTFCQFGPKRSKYYQRMIFLWQRNFSLGWSKINEKVQLFWRTMW